MPEKVPAHNHCYVCMKSIPVNEKLCSDECKQKYHAMLKKKRLSMYFMYGILAAMVVVVILFSN
jgi:predicted nucleic acid-binding Zn ribbon protein